VRPEDRDAAAALSGRFVQAMRGFAGAVCVVTVADGDERSGFTATSVSSFSAEPPMVVASLKATSSSAGLLERTRRFGVNLLRAEQRAIAERFTGFRGEQGEARYGDDEWLQMTPNGAPLLADSVAAMDCEVEELLVRHGHLLVIGRVRAVVRDESVPRPLVYWRGQYTAPAGPLAAAG